MKKAIDYDDIHNSDDEEKAAISNKKQREEAAKERLKKIECVLKNNQGLIYKACCILEIYAKLESLEWRHRFQKIVWQILKIL